MSCLEDAVTPAAPPQGSTTAGLVIATDGSHRSDGAVRVGLALAARDDVIPDVVSVVEPPMLADPDGVPLPDAGHLLELARDARVVRLLAQRDRTHPGTRSWPFSVEVGPRVDTIVAHAARTNASLILLGLGTHGVSARLRQRETALRVIRAADRPVLGLPSYASGVPHSAVVAADFSASSERAAQAALSLLGVEGTLYLAHVTPRIPIRQGDSRTWDDPLTNPVLPKLAALLQRLDPSPGIRIEYVHLHGDPARELLAFAKEYSVDVIASGTHGRSAVGRLVMGSVATALIRHAESWVLVAPPQSDANASGDAAEPNDWI